MAHGPSHFIVISFNSLIIIMLSTTDELEKRKDLSLCFVVLSRFLISNSFHSISQHSASDAALLLTTTTTSTRTAPMAICNTCSTFHIKRTQLFSASGAITISSRRSRSRRNCKWIGRRASMEQNKEDKAIQVDINRAKAREALRQLDQQLESLSESRPQPPVPAKTNTPEPEMDMMSSRDFFMRRDGREEMPEISDSYLAYTAGALVLLTIFTNIVFSFYIKPSIDGYQKPIIIERVPLSEPD